MRNNDIMFLNFNGTQNLLKNKSKYRMIYLLYKFFLIIFITPLKEYQFLVDLCNKNAFK